jgi:PIN domain nuclease of toxin-antitoxin system
VAEARNAITAPENVVAVSAASVWEVSIKSAAGRLVITDDFLEKVENSRLLPLPITAEHAWAAGQLPRHHADPFDRVIVAQAQLEGLTIVTHDPQIARYQVAILPA